MAQIRKRTLKSGAVSYEVRIHRAGHPDLSKSFLGDKAAARAWANETEAAINKGSKVNLKTERTLLSDVLAEFRQDWVDGKGAPANETEVRRLEALSHDLGEFAVASVDHDLVKKYVAKLLATEVPAAPNRVKLNPLYRGDRVRTYSPSTVRKLYYQLKKSMEWHARRHGYHLDPHVFEGQAIPAAWANARERRLEGDEEARLYESARRGYAYKEESVRVIGFALETAMRSQEMLLARWQDVNFAGRTLNIPKEHVKTETFRQVPLSKRALEIIEQQKECKSDDSERIFWTWEDSRALGKHFRRICHRAGIQDLVIHDLRHEATSRFFEKGKLSDMEIMKITGHTQYSTLERYVKLRPSVLADKMD
jgi:integrase